MFENLSKYFYRHSVKISLKNLTIGEGYKYFDGYRNNPKINVTFFLGPYMTFESTKEICDSIYENHNYFCRSIGLDPEKVEIYAPIRFFSLWSDLYELGYTTYKYLRVIPDFAFLSLYVVLYIFLFVIDYIFISGWYLLICLKIWFIGRDQIPFVNFVNSF